ncbi:MAG TPA: HAD-IA family hydrolase [Thermoanaerobaculia bacterium]|nr:HAD-IA family hydrolase [Thermoanaerobaculia bacterium]
MRAVLFDAGATLLYPDPPVEEVYARIFADDGARFTPGELRDALTATWIEVQREKPGDRYGGVSGEPAFWRGFLTRVRGLLDGGPLSEDAFANLARHFGEPSSWALYPDVLPTLDALTAAGLPLAIVSNWDSQLPRLLERRGLARHFRTVSVSAIEETGKPGAEIFRRTCERLGVEAGEALHVGDSLRDDYEGARAAGLRALLLDRRGEHRDIPERIASLAEVPDHLRAEDRAERSEGPPSGKEVSGKA